MIEFIRIINELKYLLFIAIGFQILPFIYNKFFKFDFKKRKHKNKIITADKVILKVKSFEGEFRNQRTLSYLRKIDPYVFEELILNCFELKGFKVIRNKSYSGDGGLDGMVIETNKKFLIQAKRYSNSIKTSHIEDFSTLIFNTNADGGYFIHTGKTSVKAYDNYKNSNIKIISGQKLIDFITT